MLSEERSDVIGSKTGHLVNTDGELGKVSWGKVASELGLK